MVMKFLRNLTDPNPAGEFFGDIRVFGGKGGGKAPAAPDPTQTAAAQGQMSKDVALWNSALNNVNQITPFGNLTWSLGNHSSTGGQQGGMQSSPVQNTSSSGQMYVGPDGRVYNTSTPNWVDSYRSNNPKNSDGIPAFGSQFSPEQFAASGFTPLSTNASGGSANGGASSSGGGQFNANGLPQWTSSVSLSPESQAIFDSYMRQQNQLGGLSESALNQVRQAYANPYNYDSLQSVYGADDLDAARARTEDAIYSRLNPQFAKDEEALRSRLINQGIGQGSQAYAREMENFNQMKNDARMQAVLAGGAESDRALAQSLSLRQQGIQELDKLRGQPLNEYLAMSGQQQLSMPQFQQHNYSGAATPDYQGLVNQNYQNQMAQYNANQASSNNMMSSLFGLGGAVAGSFLGQPQLGAMAGGAVGSMFR